MVKCIKYFIRIDSIICFADSEVVGELVDYDLSLSKFNLGCACIPNAIIMP